MKEKEEEKEEEEEDEVNMIDLKALIRLDLVARDLNGRSTKIHLHLPVSYIIIVQGVH